MTATPHAPSASPLIDEWTAWLHAADRAESTIALRRYHLGAFTDSLGPIPLEQADLTQIVAFLDAHHWSPGTRRSYRASLTQFFHWAYITQRIPHEPTALLLPSTRPRNLPRPAPDDVISDAIQRIDPRTRLMVLLGAEAGLRRAEIAQVHAQDVTKTPDGPQLHILGKGRRDRFIPLTSRLAAEISWRQSETGPSWIFPSTQSDGPIGAIRVGELVSAALPDPWTCHSLRHRFATVTYRNCHDLLLVQQLLGHAKPETTAAYIALDTHKAANVVQNASLAA